MKKSELNNGAIILTRNENVYLKVDSTLLNLKELGSWLNLDNYGDDLTLFQEKDFDIVKVYNDVENMFGCYSAAIQKWINNDEPTWERPKSILLDDKEKEYLSAVIKPFRKKVKYICKCYYHMNIKSNHLLNLYEKTNYIIICLENEKKEFEEIHLPYFKASTMYKGIEEEKKYTLEELEI